MEKLPIPSFFQPQKVGELWKVPYQEREAEARQWVAQYGIKPAIEDKHRIGLLLVDVQNTFCLPGFELYVGGRSGTGAVDDNRRLCEFIYQHLHQLTEIIITMDTHQAMQIFHAIFLVDRDGNHPPAYSNISYEDIQQGKWSINPAVCTLLKLNEEQAKEYLLHYTKSLAKKGKYQLTIWPYHAMLGSIGHALVAAIEEAVFFHTVARYSQPTLLLKGDQPLTEHYSIVGPEVLTFADGKRLAKKSTAVLQKLRELDALFIAGQAKSHCVAWTVEDIIAQIRQTKELELFKKIYLLEDCTSPVVIEGAIDYTDEADAAYRRFAETGLNVITSDKWL